MASSIDITKPTTGSPTTSSVRDNFNAAKSEIEALQTSNDLKAPIASPTFTGTATIPTAVVTSFTLNGVAVTSTGAELNLLDGVTATTAEINYLDGVTSNIQTQLDAKQGSGSYLTGNETITLSGDATGSGTTAITVTVDMSGLSGTTYAAGSGASITAVDAESVDGYDVVVTTQATYDGLTPDANTLYFING